MNLCLDLGNTTLKLAYFVKAGFHEKPVFKALVKNDRIPQIAKIFKQSGVRTVDKVIICSTFPNKTEKVARLVQRFYGISPLSADRTVKGKFRSSYQKLAKLGQDRKVNIYGLIQQRKYPSAIISFGTAVTVDFISAKGLHEGGLILPGLSMSAASLHQKTQTLPLVRFKPQVVPLLGLDTSACIKSGILSGTAMALEGILQAIKKSHHVKKLHVLAVGGEAGLMKAYCHFFDDISSDHTLLSLNLLLNSFDN